MVTENKEGKNKNLVDFGIRLEKARENSGVPLQQVAKAIHFSKKKYLLLETGDLEIDINQFSTLCKLFDVKGDYLLMGESDLQRINPFMVSMSDMEKLQPRVATKMLHMYFKMGK